MAIAYPKNLIKSNVLGGVAVELIAATVVLSEVVVLEDVEFSVVVIELVVATVVLLAVEFTVVFCENAKGTIAKITSIIMLNRKRFETNGLTPSTLPVDISHHHIEAS